MQRNLALRRRCKRQSLQCVVTIILCLSSLNSHFCTYCGVRIKLWSGDKFCVYVSDRLVMKNLTAEQIKGIGEGTYSLDHQIRDFIRTELSYRYVLVSDDPTARVLEDMDFKLPKGRARSCWIPCNSICEMRVLQVNDGLYYVFQCSGPRIVNIERNLLS